MSKALYKNNAETVLAASISSSATSLTVAIGDGVKFPSPLANQHATLTITDGISFEIVTITSRVGDVLNITRRQQGTFASAWNVGAIASMRLTASDFENIHLMEGDKANSVLVGAGVSSGIESVAVGGFAEGTKTLAIGGKARANGANSVSAGYGSATTGVSSVAVGYRSKALGLKGIAIGSDSNSGAGDNAITIGNAAKNKGTAYNDHDINIGYKSYTNNNYSTGIGWNSRAYGFSSIAIGSSSWTGANNCISVGNDAQSYGYSSLSIGTHSRASNYSSIAIGGSSQSKGRRSIGIGDDAKAFAYGSIAIGGVSDSPGNCSIAVGKDSTASSTYSIGIGYYGVASAAYAIAVGGYSYASGYKSINVGTYSKTSGTYSVHVGTNGGNAGNYSTSIGYASSANATQSVAIGSKAVNIVPQSVLIAGGLLVQKSKPTATPCLDFAGAEVVYATESIALAALSTYTIPLPIGAVFIPTSCGIIVDASTGIITTQPTVQVSISGDGILFTPITAAALTTALTAKRRFQDLPIVTTGDTATHLKADVTVAGASTLIYTGRVYVKGILIQE